jgi:hypothetical protein
VHPTKRDLGTAAIVVARSHAHGQFSSGHVIRCCVITEVQCLGQGLLWQTDASSIAVVGLSCVDATYFPQHPSETAAKSVSSPCCLYHTNPVLACLLRLDLFHNCVGW